MRAHMEVESSPSARNDARNDARSSLVAGGHLPGSFLFAFGARRPNPRVRRQPFVSGLETRFTLEDGLAG